MSDPQEREEAKKLLNRMRQSRGLKFYMKKDDSSDNPYIIPVFIPFQGCPNKCIFCNQNAVTGIKTPALPEREELLKYFNEFLSYSKKDKKRVEIAFFGGNFLGMDDSLIIKYLEIAKEFCGNYDSRGIRFSTRPDTIMDHKLDLLKDYPVKTIELGIQSIDDKVLKKAGRGHSAKDSFSAVELIKKRMPDVDLGLQIMIGLPGDSRNSIFKTLYFIKKSKPVYLRIYPTIVLKNTGLEKLFQRGLYKPVDLETAVDISSVIRDFCKKNKIRIIRMGIPPEGASHNEIVAGPWHPSFGELVISRSFYKRISLKLALHGKKTENKKLVLKLNSSFESSARGWKNKNIKNLEKRFPFKNIIVEKDNNIDFEDFSFEILNAG